MFVETKKLSHVPLDPVSYDRLADFLGHRHTEPDLGQLVRPEQDQKISGLHSSPSLPGGFQEITPFQESLRFTEFKCTHVVPGLAGSAGRIVSQSHCAGTGRQMPLQTESRFLPLALLRLITSAPALVLMRTRKPCVRFLFTLLGWYVLFIASFYPEKIKNMILIKFVRHCQGV
jgi:hypothetical protein